MAASDEVMPWVPDLAAAMAGVVVTGGLAVAAFNEWLAESREAEKKRLFFYFAAGETLRRRHGG